MIDTILFDLDGTLLPFSQEEFIKRYFDLISVRAKNFGYEKEPFLKALWAGTKAMLNNDGSRSNREAFWDVFSQLLGNDVLALEAEFESFYAHEFNLASDVMQHAVDHSEFISGLKKRGFTVVLATNPLFPAVAVKSRLGWAGLKPEDFSFITNYENSSFCKPSCEYFKNILSQIQNSASNCLMVGNNVDEDMCAASLGLEVFLVTDNIETTGIVPIESFQNGSFEDFMRFAEALPSPR